MKYDLIDPISVLINLSMLKHKEIGTKLSITNNIVKIDNCSVFQCFKRKLQGHCKNDMKLLQNPLTFICLQIAKDRTDLDNFLQNALDGLEKLKVTYKSETEILGILNSYITILTKSKLKDANFLENVTYLTK